MATGAYSVLSPKAHLQVNLLHFDHPVFTRPLGRLLTSDQIRAQIDDKGLKGLLDLIHKILRVDEVFAVCIRSQMQGRILSGKKVASAD